MSRMSELNIDIQEQLELGVNPYVISKRLGVPVEWVFEVEADLNGEVPMEQE